MMRSSVGRIRETSKLPDPIAVVHSVAFAGVDETELTKAAELLETATQRLNNHGLTE